MRKGIDLSTWQKTVSWPTVKASGVEFVMLRAGFGTTPDNMFDTHINGALSVGIPVGAYWFSYALNAEDAKAEAQKCLEIIKPYKLDYPIAYDFEYDSVKKAAAKGVTITKDLATAIVKAFCDEIAAAGYTPYIYANPDYLKSYIDKEKVGREIWLAAWQNEDPPKINKAAECRIWQYKVGTCAGVDGNCDLDVWYDDAEIAEARNPKVVAAPAEDPNYTLYTVVKGDTPWALAGRFLGNSFKYPEIMKLNGLAVDADIYVGQKLKIPKQTAQPAAPVTQGRTYKVVKGDTLWGIASRLLKNGARYTEIKKLNNLKSDIIHVGDTLKIPEK